MKNKKHICGKISETKIYRENLFLIDEIAFPWLEEPLKNAKTIILGQDFVLYKYEKKYDAVKFLRKKFTNRIYFLLMK